MKCPKVSKNKVGERDGGMPDSSLKAELSLFDFTQKMCTIFFEVKIIRNVQTSSYIIDSMRRCQIDGFRDFRWTKLNKFLEAPRKIPYFYPSALHLISTIIPAERGGFEIAYRSRF